MLARLEEHLSQPQSFLPPDSLAQSSPVFARHETFHPRFGWLKKGFDKTLEDSGIFTRDEAPVTLGVGKNMVKSIRYWCKAYKIIEDKKGTCIPTKFGTALFSDKDGWDPFLEDLGSLWLLHWNLLKLPSHASAWYLIFNRLWQSEFTQQDLIYVLTEGIQTSFPAFKFNESSLKKDINCLLRMYVKQTQTKVNEESLDCPFAELSLIFRTEGSYYRFHSGNKSGLCPEIIVATCLEFAAARGEQSQTLSITRLLYDNESPGMVFKLTESSLYHAIEQVSKIFPAIALSDTAGLIQLSFEGDPYTLAQTLLSSYYQNRNH